MGRGTSGDIIRLSCSFSARTLHHISHRAPVSPFVWLLRAAVWSLCCCCFQCTNTVQTNSSSLYSLCVHLVRVILLLLLPFTTAES